MRANDDVGSWVWLFPLTYAAHLAEERLMGFPRWFSQVFQGDLTLVRFWAINGLGFLLVVVGTAAARFGGVILTVPVLGTVVALNGATHVIASLLTGSYSPGAVTGGLLWIPLGAFALRWSARRLSLAAMSTSIVVGALMLAMVFRTALGR